MVFPANKLDSNQMDFRMKFTDAHSEKTPEQMEEDTETKETEQETDTLHAKGEFLDDPVTDDDEDDALPDSFYTAGATHHYPTPGGGAGDGEFIEHEEQKENIEVK